jgi:hypothetical protein
VGRCDGREGVEVRTLAQAHKHEPHTRKRTRLRNTQFHLPEGFFNPAKETWKEGIKEIGDIDDDGDPMCCEDRMVKIRTTN